MFVFYSLVEIQNSVVVVVVIKTTMSVLKIHDSLQNHELKIELFVVD
tara:strand:+ start:142 stop:282 length:141 start_codon:yes stop_codon:yes gene_type:complete